MTLEEAQADMRCAYFNGATGVVASATAWIAAAIASVISTPLTAIVTLLIGGMFIFPASVVLSKILGRCGIHAKDNPLSSLAAGGTVWMLFVIPIAYGASLHRIEWFFPAMLLTIGGRYLTFATLYGLRIYLFLGAALAIAGVILVVASLPFSSGVLAGAAIEFIFGAVLFFGPNFSFQRTLDGAAE